MSDKITGNITLTDDQIQELRAQVGIYYNHANGYHQGEMGVKTRMAWEYYYGRLPEPITNGSSQWIDRSVWDSVNGTLQELISVFTSGEDTVRFSPINHADSDNARAATKMVNQVLLRDNMGYNVLHDAFKECLIARNSFVKRFWNTETKIVNETFDEMTQQEFDMYMTQLEGEVVTMDAEEDENGLISGEVTYEIIRDGVKVEYVPFEQVIVEPTATSLRDCNYIAHRVRKSKDELHMMEFNPKIIETLQPASSDIEAGVIANARVN
ncbi:MAG: portal protein, partial [Bacteroidales bacterium]